MRYVTCLLIVVAVRGEPDMDGLLKVGKSARKAGEIYAHARFRGVGAASEDVLLSNALSRAELDSEAASERLQDDIGACPGCVHDYNDKCPMDWTLNAKGDACKADYSYAGPCSNELFVEAIEEDDKIATEIRCLVCWPCLRGNEKAGSAYTSEGQSGPIDPVSGGIIAA